MAACQHVPDIAINDAKRLYHKNYEEGGSVDNLINFVASLDGFSNRYELAALCIEKKYTQKYNSPRITFEAIVFLKSFGLPIITSSDCKAVTLYVVQG
jgi:hypothetical protein